jgi:general secretion pathway protein H
VQTFPVPAASNDLLIEFLSAQKTGGAILLGGTVVETEPLAGGVTFFSDGTCTAFRAQIRANGGAHIIAIDPWPCSPGIAPAQTP